MTPVQQDSFDFHVGFVFPPQYDALQQDQMVEEAAKIAKTLMYSREEALREIRRDSPGAKNGYLYELWSVPLVIDNAQIWACALWSLCEGQEIACTIHAGTKKFAEERYWKVEAKLLTEVLN